MAALASSPKVITVGDDASFDKELLVMPRHYAECVETVLIPDGLIQARVDKMAADILAAYEGQTVHLLCVLKGGSIFFSDLLKALNTRFANLGKDYIPYSFDFIRVSSYEGTESTGNVKIDMARKSLEELAGRHVLFVEDILDTCHTMRELYKYFESHAACLSVDTASLLIKRTPRAVPGFTASFVGFSIPDKFVIGYGLDYNEKFRDLQHISVISAAGISKYAV